MTKSKSTAEESTEAEAPEGGTTEPVSEEKVSDGMDYEARVIEPVEEPEPSETDDAPVEIPEGHVLIRYVGPADAFDHKAYQFRGDKPVAVPSEVAEELLTYPFERFERV